MAAATALGLFRYAGSSLSNAFPQNPMSFDIWQVKNQSGKVVWNLTSAGVANVNPSSPTAQSLMETYEGSSFAAAFSNPSSLDVFQILNPATGAVVAHVDSTGNYFTP